MLLSVFGTFSAYAQTETGTWGKDAENSGTWSLTDGVLTIEGVGECRGGGWNHEKENGFTKNSSIKKIIIGEGVTVLGEDIFSQYDGLKEVVFPESLTGIHECAFYGCDNLEKADLPSHIEYVGVRAFRDCTALKKIELPESLKNIYYAAFFDCHSATGKIVIPKNAKLGRLAFYNCDKITEVRFEDGFYQEDYASVDKCFSKCDKLKKVYIPGSMKGMLLSCFKDCPALEEVKICEGVEHIGGISGSNALEKITLPKSAKTISDFTRCPNLKSIKIQSKIEYFHGHSFLGCALKSIKFPYGADTIEQCAFGYDLVYNESGDWIDVVPVKNFKVYGKKCKALTEYCKNSGFKFIDMYDVKNATVKGLGSKRYTGKAIKPSITVKLAGATLKKDTDYTVKYTNNTKVGTAKVTIKGKGKYKGTLEKTFKINPKPTELKKVTAGKKSFKAYWKKQDVKTYQLQYSTYKSFKNGKKITVKATAKTVKDLKSNKKYYVRVRTYKTIKGVKYYSKWSEAKTVKTK